VIALFQTKIRGINAAVDALQRVDKEHYGRIVLEVMCLSALVKAGEATYKHKLEGVSRDDHPAESLATCDIFQRSLYLLACKWLACMLQLRKLIKAYLTKRKGDNPARTVGDNLSGGGSFTLGGVTFNVPTVESAPASPHVSEEPTLTPSEISKTLDYGETKERRKRVGSSDALSSINDDERSPKSIISSAATSVDGDSELSKSSSAVFIPPSEKLLAAKSAIDLKEVRFAKVCSLLAEVGFIRSNSDVRIAAQVQQPSWKMALWELYRVLGRSTTGSEFSVNLPEGLAAGHPSLPHRWKDRAVLVNHMVPITLVAYALASDTYEEQMDAWKLVVHRENTASVTMDAKKERHDRSDALVPVSTNWSRAALTSSLSTPFKHNATDVPLHLSLLSEKSSLGLWNSSWDLSMVAYYPLQVSHAAHSFYCCSMWIH